MVCLCSAVGTAAAQWNVTDLVTLVLRKIKETERTNKIGNKLRISPSHLSSHRFWNSEAMVKTVIIATMSTDTLLYVRQNKTCETKLGL